MLCCLGPSKAALELEESRDCSSNLSRLDGFNNLSDFRRKAMRDFSLGFAKFENPPTLGPLGGARPRHRSYARTAAISRLLPVQDGVDYWEKIASPPAPIPPADASGGAAWPGFRTNLAQPATQRLPLGDTPAGQSLEHRSGADTDLDGTAPLYGTGN
jgi:hypothetical protein